jgi:hypothetical protein
MVTGNHELQPGSPKASIFLRPALIEILSEVSKGYPEEIERIDGGLSGERLNPLQETDTLASGQEFPPKNRGRSQIPQF